MKDFESGNAAASGGAVALIFAENFKGAIPGALEGGFGDFGQYRVAEAGGDEDCSRGVDVLVC